MIVVAPASFAPGNRGDAHAAAADHGHGFAALDRAGVDRGADAGHHAAAQEPDGGRIGVLVDLGALPGGNERLLRERTDPQRRRQLRAVLQGHLLGGVVRVEAVLRLALGAGPALAADRAPVQDHPVPGSHLGDIRADGGDHAGSLMAQQDGEIVGDSAQLVMQVRVADPAGENVHQRLARARIRHQNGLHRDRGVLFLGNDRFYFMNHELVFLSSVLRTRCNGTLAIPSLGVKSSPRTPPKGLMAYAPWIGG